MDVEAKPAFASRNIEIEAAVAEVQVPRWVEGIVDGAEHLPIGVGADPKAADIAIGGETPAIAEIAVIARADQRVGPGAAGVHAHTAKQTRVELHPRRKSPSTEAKTGIAELHRVLEKAVESDPGAGIRPQSSVAAIKENVMRRNLGADRQVDGVREKAEGPVANLERPHKRGPIEMRQEIDRADVGVHLWLTRQRRHRGCVDAGEPKIGCHEELVSAWGGY